MVLDLQQRCFSNADIVTSHLTEDHGWYLFHATWKLYKVGVQILLETLNQEDTFSWLLQGI